MNSTCAVTDQEHGGRDTKKAAQAQGLAAESRPQDAVLRPPWWSAEAAGLSEWMGSW
jgi:hypothetical protein